MSRGDYRHRPRNWRNDPEMVHLHRTALTVACRHCHQPVGEACVHPDLPGRPPLENLPCHPVRESDAKRGPKQL
uniref:HNH endonuclease n=1 Tax=Mycobacterium phage JustASigh TaxID=3158894 RepID=A0AAU8GNJ2_9CAUD